MVGLRARRVRLQSPRWSLPVGRARPQSRYAPRVSTAVRTALLGTLLALVVAPASAHAEVRSGQVSDPRDVPEALSGPRQVDIQEVAASYDTAGTLTASVTLHEAFPQTKRSYPNFSVGFGQKSSYPGTCDNSVDGSASISGSVDPATANTGTLKVAGMDGSLAATRRVSADQRTLTFTVSASQLANRGYICAGGGILSTPDPYGHCFPNDGNCQTIAYAYYGDSAAAFFFAGFAPPTPACNDNLDNDGDGRIDLKDPECITSTTSSEGRALAACENGRDDDGDGKIDVKDPGCAGNRGGGTEADPAPERSTAQITALRSRRRTGGRCTLDVEVDVTPDFRPPALYPFNRVRVVVEGVGRAVGYLKVRSLGLGADPGYSFRVRRGFRYRVHLRYPGDRFRLASEARSRTVTTCPTPKR